MISEVRGYSIGSMLIKDRYVSTIVSPRPLPFSSEMMETFETIIFEWDGERVGRIIDQIHHRSKKEAEKVHDYIIRNLSEGA